MPDISACVNHTCPKKDDCYRFRCIWGKRQTYAKFAPDASGNCEFHMEIDGRKCSPVEVAVPNAVTAAAMAGW